MKRGLVIIFLLLLLNLQAVILGITGEVITGETITGEVTGNVDINVSVILSSPNVIIHSPKNNTYLSNTSVLLNFTITSEESIWYNIDNGVNTTISTSTTISIPEGGHILYLFANHSNGNVTVKNVSFSVNTSLLTIINSEFNGTTKGDSIAFINYSYEELQNIVDITLENTNFGKINFNEPINTTSDDNFSDRILNLDSNIKIGFNIFELDSTALPNFNKSSTIIFYNLNFTTPRILRNGEVCSSDICIQNYYNGGNLSFNVTSFTNYSSEETPLGEGSSSPTGGGSGGSGVASVINKKGFSIDETIIRVMHKQGESLVKRIKIKNTDNVVQTFSLKLTENLEELVILSENNFVLKQNEEKEVFLTFVSKENTLPDVYAGKLIISTSTNVAEISIIDTIKSRLVVFDVSIDIPLENRRLERNEDLFFQITIFDLVGVGKKEVSVDYIIKDFEGRIIASELEIVTIDTQVSFLKRMNLPEDINYGDYLIVAKVSYDNSIASSSSLFRIFESTKDFYPRSLLSEIYILIIVLIVILIAVIISYIIFINPRKFRNKSRRNNKKYVRKIMRMPNSKRKLPRKIIKNIGFKLDSLNKAFEEGYVSEESYRKGKSRLERYR